MACTPPVRFYAQLARYASELPRHIAMLSPIRSQKPMLYGFIYADGGCIKPPAQRRHCPLGGLADAAPVVVRGIAKGWANGQQT